MMKIVYLCWSWQTSQQRGKLNKQRVATATSITDVFASSIVAEGMDETLMIYI